MNSSVEIISRPENKADVIGIMGLSYVGLPLPIRLNEVDHKVGFDIVAAKVERLNQGLSLTEHIPDQAFRRARGAGSEATTTFARVGECDALILCVPTPPNKYRDSDFSFVLKTTESSIPHMRPGRVMSLEGATYPGTTDDEVVACVDGAGFFVGSGARGALRSQGHHG